MAMDMIMMSFVRGGSGYTQQGFASAAFFEDAAVSSCERAVRAIEATDAVEACVLHA